MRIAARMAFDTPWHERGARDFFGGDVVLKTLSETGFEAECQGDHAPGAIVRLRLPCAGTAIARIVDAQPGWLRGEFVNPLGPARLKMTLGVHREAAFG